MNPNIFILALVATFLACPTLTRSQVATSMNPPMEITEGWEYRWGDSPIDSSGHPIWTSEAGGAAWRDVSRLSNPPDRDGHRFLWLRVSLPNRIWETPTLFLPPTYSSFEIYLNSEVIYSYGNFKAEGLERYPTVTSHLISLPDEFQGANLVLRIHSDMPQFIGVYDIYHKVAIGSYTSILKEKFGRHIDSLIVGILLVFLGLFAILIFIRRFKERVFFPVSFGVFSILMGLFYTFTYPIGLIFVEWQWAKYYVGHVAYFLFPVGLYAFFEHIIGRSKIVKTLWLTHLACAGLALALDWLNVMPMFMLQLYYYNGFFILTISIVFILGVIAAINGNIEARIYVAGFSVFALLGLYDLAVSLEWLPFWHGLSHWGALFFILALGYVLERRFNENHAKLHRYSEELAVKSAQLEEYSQKLEEKVEERTKDLQNTLKELRETQEQLVMKEKMASLGNLVAGVAHEVNNPIGAIHSAADMTSRCIEKIKSLVNSDGAGKTADFQKALRLLEENSKITAMATDRVGNIVKSLKSFARLDEAEFQEADLHEGLDSTLTLIQHELKDRVRVEKQYGDLPKVECYPNQLNQVFMNILMNAVQAIEGKGTITIRTSVDQNEVRVKISDTGSGIPREKIDKIFDPGFTLKGVGVGTGLGLSISYNIIQKHKGQIEVESEVGKGSTFTIVLPIRHD